MVAKHMAAVGYSAAYHKVEAYGAYDVLNLLKAGKDSSMECVQLALFLLDAHSPNELLRSLCNSTATEYGILLDRSTIWLENQPHLIWVESSSVRLQAPILDPPRVGVKVGLRVFTLCQLFRVELPFKNRCIILHH